MAFQEAEGRTRRTKDPSIRSALHRHSAGPLPAVLALVGSGLFALSLSPVPDHGYQFYLARRVLDGARLYVDVAAADMHPPLFTWLAMGLERVARLIGVTGLGLFPLAIVLTTAASLYAVWRIGPRSGFLAVALVLALLPLAGPYIGQGEHIALVLALPYLFSAAATLHGKVPNRAARVAIAIAAGVGLALKPHFALVWVSVEAYLASRRGPRSLWRIESVAVGVVFVLYVGLTAVVTPEFFPLLPWLMELYPRFAPFTLSSLLFDRRALLLLAALAAGAFLLRDAERCPLAAVLTLAVVAMYAAMLLQGKGWGYHWYPVSALSVVLCALAAERLVGHVRLMAAPLAVASVVVMNLQVDRTARLLASPPTFLPELLRLADEHAPGRAVLGLSQYINIGFPLVNLTGAQWASPYGHLWMVPAIYHEAWYGNAPLEYRSAGKWGPLEQQIFDRTWDSIERNNPGLVIVERSHFNRFDMRQYFETDPRYHAFFARATVLDTIGPFVVYGEPREPRTVAAALEQESIIQTDGGSRR